MKKIILAIAIAFSLGLVMESCGTKHACGTKHQKKKRNKRVKKGTTFMTY